eukprot:g57354.t1
MVLKMCDTARCVITRFDWFGFGYRALQVHTALEAPQDVSWCLAYIRFFTLASESLSHGPGPEVLAECLLQVELQTTSQ